MQTELVERERKPALIIMSTTSSMELSGEEDKQHQHLAVVVKRERTKRPRHHPPAKSASSSESTTTEEEDMAHCLILLAQGAAVDSKPSPAPAPVQPQAQPSPPAAAPPPVVKSERYKSRKYTEAATTVDGVRAGFYVYECKTCNKCFSSFQALGGHRTSHKKPRLAPPLPTTTPFEDKKPAVAETTTAEEKPPPPPPAQATTDPTVLAIPVIPKQEVDTNATTTTIMSSSKQRRVHECSICSAEFASGQALGGHMRRHRPLVPTSVSAVDDGPRKEKSLLELDLNMPAPCDDGEASPAAFVYAVKERSPLLFPASASALVDCHY